MGILPLAERTTQVLLNKLGTKSRWVETSAGKLHVYDTPGQGTLPTVVLLHGLACSAVQFATVLQILRRRVRRILTPDAPGHGLSAPPTVPLTTDVYLSAMNEFLDRELEEPAILVANSLGGAVAINYTLSNSDRVQGLVLCSPAGAKMEPFEIDEVLCAFRLRSRSEARMFLRRIYHRVPWFSVLFTDDLVRTSSYEHIVSFVASSYQYNGFSPEQLGSLKCPILLIWGRSDRLWPSACLGYFRKNLPPHARIEEPNGIGHSPQLDSPEYLAQKIISFSEDLVRASSPFS